MQEATTFSIFYDGTSFQHLAAVLISVFTLCYGPGLLFRGQFCISMRCSVFDRYRNFWGRKVSYPEEVASSTPETFVFMYPSYVTLRYIPILTAMKSSNINSLLISTLQVPKNCNISQKRISRTSSTHGALQRCDPMNAEFHVCYSRFIFQCQTALVDPGLLTVQIYRSHKTTHHSQQESSGRVIGPCQRRLPGNTQHSQDTDIHAPGGIRSRNLRKRAAPDPRLRSHSHWNRHSGSDV